MPVPELTRGEKAGLQAPSEVDYANQSPLKATPRSYDAGTGRGQLRGTLASPNEDVE